MGAVDKVYQRDFGEGVKMGVLIIWEMVGKECFGYMVLISIV